jgi:hypothetical protein
VSRDRVELIEVMFDSWNAGARDLAVLREYLDPGIELEGPLSSVVGAPYRGYRGIEQWIRDVDEQFSEWSISPDNVREIEDQVIATVTVTARGRRSDVALHFPSAAGVFDFAGNDRVRRICMYPDIREALEAVGPKE